MNTLTMENELFNNNDLNKDNMYKTLESQQALQDYLEIKHELNQIKEKHKAAMQRSYTVTWFILQEIFKCITNTVNFQKLRSKNR